LPQLFLFIGILVFIYKTLVCLMS